MAKNKWATVHLTRAFSWTNAEHMVELSRDAYLPEKEFKKIYPRAKFLYNEETDTECYLWRPAKSHQPRIVFRGTEANSFEDIKTDISVKHTESAGELGEVHLGFKTALDSVWKDIEKWLKPTDKDVFITGHSLGAALATVASVRINNEHVRLYTFGSPKCVDQEVVDNVSIGGHAWRFRNNNDIVTKVPPWGFKHLGKTMYFNANGDWVEHLTKWTFWMGWFRGTWDGLKNKSWDGFRDHSVNNYVYLVGMAKAKEEDEFHKEIESLEMDIKA